ARAVGFSILLLEALAAGLPVVALPAPGVPAAGLHWAAAMLAPHHSAPSLAEAVEEALEVDHAERVGAGRRIARRFDWSNVARRVRAVYKQVWSGRARARRSLLGQELAPVAPGRPRERVEAHVPVVHRRVEPRVHDEVRLQRLVEVARLGRAELGVLQDGDHPGVRGGVAGAHRVEAPPGSLLRVP